MLKKYMLLTICLPTISFIATPDLYAKNDNAKGYARTYGNIGPSAAPTPQMIYLLQMAGASATIYFTGRRSRKKKDDI